jgi:hypothetical protein
MASHNVHAGSKAILFKLGLPGRHDHLLAEVAMPDLRSPDKALLYRFSS